MTDPSAPRGGDPAAADASLRAGTSYADVQVAVNDLLEDEVSSCFSKPEHPSHAAPRRVKDLSPATLFRPAAPRSADPWDVEADPADWPADTDNWYWEPGCDAELPFVRALPSGRGAYGAKGGGA